jgi:hypothetical protein
VASGLEGGGLAPDRARPSTTTAGSCTTWTPTSPKHTTCAATEPGRLQRLQALWWQEAERHQVLPLDDRFGPRFADNGRRYQGPRQFVFHAGMGHLPTDVAPDVRGRHYRIEAEADLPATGADGVLVAHGDATSGYSLYLQDGHLVHDLNVGGQHQLLRSPGRCPPVRRRLAVQVEQGPMTTVQPRPAPAGCRCPQSRQATLLIDGQPAGSAQHAHGFNSLISWSGLDIGLDRGSPVSHYAAPFAFTGRLRRVTVTLDDHGGPDGEAVGQAEMARQ